MDYYLQIILIAGIFIILSLSLNLINGLCGQFSLGHAGFWGVGAYASAIFTVYYPLPVPAFLNMIIALFIGFGASALCGLIIGVPCLRLKGDYLAIATLGFGEILRIIIMNTELVGGPRGFINIPHWANIFWVYALVIICIAFMLNLKHSNYGRAIIAIREDEIAAENMGVDLFYFKLFSFTVGAGIAGIAGALFAHTQQFLHPNNFNFTWSVVVLVMIILGGMGSITGSIISAIFLSVLPEVLRYAGGTIAEWRMTIFPILLIVLMLARPQGIFGSHEISLKKGLHS
jgi:branched-chain amino acid transport system permease protein